MRSGIEVWDGGKIIFNILTYSHTILYVRSCCQFCSRNPFLLFGAIWLAAFNKSLFWWLLGRHGLDFVCMLPLVILGFSSVHISVCRLYIHRTLEQILAILTKLIPLSFLLSLSYLGSYSLQWSNLLDCKGKLLFFMKFIDSLVWFLWLISFINSEIN